MRTLVERCCGLDVHQEMVVAYLLIGEPGKPLRQEVRTWATTTRALEALRDWLQAEKVTHVGGHPCRYGEHRRLLAPHLRRAGRALRPDRRQCPAHQDRARAQDR